MFETPPYSGLLNAIEGFTGYRDRDVPGKLRHWLLDGLKSARYARLEQAGHQDTKLALARVFVDIVAVARERHQCVSGEDDPGAGVESLRPGIAAEVLSSRPMMPPEPEATLRAHLPDEQARSRYLFIGGPGQGKSTVTQYICQIHRVSALAAAVDRLEPQHAEVIREVREQADADGLPDVAHPCIPAQVILPQLAAWMVNHNVEPARVPRAPDQSSAALALACFSPAIGGPTGARPANLGGISIIASLISTATTIISNSRLRPCPPPPWSSLGPAALAARSLHHRPVGISDFRELREKELTYVDTSGLLIDIIDMLRAPRCCCCPGRGDSGAVSRAPADRAGVGRSRA